MIQAYSRFCFFLLVILLTLFQSLFAQDSTYTKEEVIYGRKDGMALTMIVAKPVRNANGKGIIQVISSGYFSSIDAWNVNQVIAFVANGFTVFAVAHGWQPRYTIPEILLDMQRAVRFVKYNAKRFGIDAARLGVTGSSSGGNLSLLLGLQDGRGNPESKDPVDHLSSKVGAVAVFAPPIDWNHWQSDGANVMSSDLLVRFAALKPAFTFKKVDPGSHNYLPISDTSDINKILAEHSPINFVSPDDPAVLLVHGNNDRLVSHEQSEKLYSLLKQQKINSDLIIIEGAGHTWDDKNPIKANQFYVDWFKKHLQ